MSFRAAETAKNLGGGNASPPGFLALVKTQRDHVGHTRSNPRRPA
jgi:hypothetical protein